MLMELYPGNFGVLIWMGHWWLCVEQALDIMGGAGL